MLPSELVKVRQEEYLDRHVTEQLKSFMKEGYGGVVELFLTQSEMHLAQLIKSVDIDKAECRLEAHSLKGSAANIGARRLSMLAEQVEKSLKSDDGAITRQLIDDAVSELDVVAPMLRCHS